ncbi:plasmid maintenance system killer protein [Spirochaetia bacterium]|nr:plasmid maintenance system killer protein [Spirochaetia bacterium]
MTIITICVIIEYMISSFNDAEAEKVWNRQFSRKLLQNIQRTALRKLSIIHNSRNLGDLKIPPGNNFEELEGDRKGQYSIRINDQWRICFKFENSNAFEVEIVDYH